MTKILKLSKRCRENFWQNYTRNGHSSFPSSLALLFPSPSPPVIRAALNEIIAQRDTRARLFPDDPRRSFISLRDNPPSGFSRTPVAQRPAVTRVTCTRCPVCKGTCTSYSSPVSLARSRLYIRIYTYIYTRGVKPLLA